MSLVTYFIAEQGQYQPLAMEVQVPIIYAGVNGLVCLDRFMPISSDSF